MEKEIDCSYTDEVVCPYYGHESGDSFEYFRGHNDTTEIECDECNKSFTAYAEYEVHYYTYKKE